MLQFRLGLCYGTQKQHKTILLVGSLEQRVYWQASDETHRPDAPTR